MAHPFGDLITQHLSRRHGLSQNKLAEGIAQTPAVISKMCKGERLGGSRARERILAIINWLYKQRALDCLEEANELLFAAGMIGLNPGSRGEDILLQTLPAMRDLKQPQGGLNRSYQGTIPPLPTLVIGRESAIRDLTTRLIPTANDQASARVQVLLAVHGWPGVGKTTLAAFLAHNPEIAMAFPDAILWVSLGPTPNILSEIIIWGRALGNDDLSHAQTVEEARARLTAFLRDKRVLLIVDDVWEKEHAFPFAVGGRGCALLITTRLPGVARALAPTSDHVYRVPPLSEKNALELLNFLAPTVVKEYPEESLDLVRELEGLPLALQVAGHLLHSEASYGWNVIDLLNELCTGVKVLQAQVPSGSVVKETIPTLAMVLKMSTERLPPQIRECFAYLGVFAPKSATFDLSVLGKVWELIEVKPIVRLLVDYGLLEAVGAGRFQMHSMLVKYAKSLLEDELSITSLQDACRRHAYYYLEYCEANPHHWEWFDREWLQIQHAWHWVSQVESDEKMVFAYVRTITTFQESRGLWREAIQWGERGLKAARTLGDKENETLVLTRLGRVHHHLGEVQTALEYHKECYQIAHEAGYRTTIGVALLNIGLEYRRLGQIRDALEIEQQACSILREVGDRPGEAKTLNGLGIAYWNLGEEYLAIDYFQQARACYQAIDDPQGEADILGNLGIVNGSLGETQVAIDFYFQAMNLHIKNGSRRGEGINRGNLGDAFMDQGEIQTAIKFYEDALAIYSDLGDREGVSITHGNLGRAYHWLGAHKKAFNFYELALIVAREIGDRTTEASVSWAFSTTCIELGKYERALELMQFTVNYEREIGHRKSEEHAQKIEEMKLEIFTKA